MIVCYFGTYREEYSRNKIMMAALRSTGIEVKECHVSLWQGIEDRVNITTGGWRSPKFWWRAIKAYFFLVMRYFKVGDFDILMVGYPGHFDVYIARFLANLRKKPLVWDVFMSLYLIAKERKLDSSKHSAVNFLRRIEEGALKKPDLLIQDTAEYVKWFYNEYNIPTEKFRLIPTGADDRIFKPLPKSSHQDGLFHVLYYGSFIPNHGVRLIIQAARLLQDQEDFIFDLIGDGPDREMAEELVENFGIQNVRFYDWMDQESLIQQINKADVCLGAFGDTPQSLMTVQNKIYECMAMGKAVITGDSPAVRDEFKHEHEIFICERNAVDLGESIKYLNNNPEICLMLGKFGYDHYEKYNSIKIIGELIVGYFSQIKNFTCEN